MKSELYKNIDDFVNQLYYTKNTIIDKMMFLDEQGLETLKHFEDKRVLRGELLMINQVIENLENFLIKEEKLSQ